MTLRSLHNGMTGIGIGMVQLAHFSLNIFSISCLAELYCRCIGTSSSFIVPCFLLLVFLSVRFYFHTFLCCIVVHINGYVYIVVCMTLKLCLGYWNGELLC